MSSRLILFQEPFPDPTANQRREGRPRPPSGPAHPAGLPGPARPRGAAAGVSDGPQVGQAPRGARGPAALRARRARALPRERAQRRRHGAAGAGGRHAVRQRLPPAARPQRARRGGAAGAGVRRPGRGPADAPGAHLRRHGGRGPRRRRLPRVLQERPQPLGRRVHRLPHAVPRPQPGARLPDGEGRPTGSRPQPRLLASAAEVRADPPGPGRPARGAGRFRRRGSVTGIAPSRARRRSPGEGVAVPTVPRLLEV